MGLLHSVFLEFKGTVAQGNLKGLYNKISKEFKGILTINSPLILKMRGVFYAQFSLVYNKIMKIMYKCVC